MRLLTGCDPNTPTFIREINEGNSLRVQQELAACALQFGNANVISAIDQPSICSLDYCDVCCFSNYLLFYLLRLSRSAASDLHFQSRRAQTMHFGCVRKQRCRCGGAGWPESLSYAKVCTPGRFSICVQS